MPDLLPPLARALAEDANVSDELRGAGIAFGTLVERTGAAVAATQLQLDTSSAATASALAATLVNVIAVREQVFRDDGTLDHVTNHVRPLPLISFIDPVFYQWTSVRLQGEFYAREFAASSETTSAYSGSNFGLFGSGAAALIDRDFVPVCRQLKGRADAHDARPHRSPARRRHPRRAAGPAGARPCADPGSRTLRGPQAPGWCGR